MAIGSPSSQCINWKWGKVKHRRPDNSAAVWHISASCVCITALSSVIAGWPGSGDMGSGGGGGGTDGRGWAVAAHFCFTKHSNNVHIRDRYLGPFDSIWDFQNEQQGKKDCLEVRLYVTRSRMHAFCLLFGRQHQCHLQDGKRVTSPTTRWPRSQERQSVWMLRMCRVVLRRETR